MRRCGTVLFLFTLAAVLSVSSLSRVLTGEETDREKVAAAALRKAVERGRALFSRVGLGTKEKACVACHEDPKRPNLHLASRVGDYPKYDRREKRVIVLGTKINQMIARMLKGEKRELGSDELVAIEAYLMSLARE